MKLDSATALLSFTPPLEQACPEEFAILRSFFFFPLRRAKASAVDEKTVGLFLTLFSLFFFLLSFKWSRTRQTGGAARDSMH